MALMPQDLPCEGTMPALGIAGGLELSVTLPWPHPHGEQHGARNAGRHASARMPSHHLHPASES